MKQVFHCSFLFLMCFLFLQGCAACADRVEIFPQFASGGGWRSNIYCTNRGTATASEVQISFFKDDGSPLTLGTNMGTQSNFTFSIYPGASEMIADISSGSLSVGYSVLTYPESASISCTEIFRFEQNGLVITELGVQPQAASQHTSFPAAVDNSNHLNTGLALANYNDQPQIVIVDLIKKDGSLLGNWLIDLPARGYRAMYLDQLVPELDSFSGAVSVSAPKPIGVLALRQDNDVLGSVAVTRGPILGPFVLRVSGAVQESEPNDSLTQAQQITDASVITGSVGSPGDVDYFKFTGRKGDLITALVDVTPVASSLISSVNLHQSDGAVLSENTTTNDSMAGGHSFLQSVLPEDGVYFVSVTDSRGQGGNGYGYKLNLSVPASVPKLSAIIPSALALRSPYPLTLTIQGSRLKDARAINIFPPGVILYTQLQSSETQVTAQVTLAPNAPLGIYGVSVITGEGTSNGLSLTLSDPDTNQFDGEWAGQTAEGQAVSFTVMAGGISQVHYGYRMGSCIGSAGISIVPPKPIQGNTFRIAPPGGQDTVIFEGTFSDGDSASGTLDFTKTGPCAGHLLTNWVAQKF